uniref:Reverse transcriptase domain-containing protein n=1 Tax=Toxocara canis TaxID=6265 RepID=A0A183U0T1_TOXCA
LRKNDQIFKAYNEIIQQQLEQGITEKAPNPAEGPTVHYLLHNAVIKPPLKSACCTTHQHHRREGVRNDQLYRGPVLPQLVGVPMRFREDEIALTADIENAFLRLELQEPNRDACRFLWLRNPDDIGAEIERSLQAYRFCCVPFGVVSSPFLLAAVLKTHLKGYPDGSAVDRNLHVENIFISAENPSEAERLYR